jgi:predicted nucleic acid-binding protein
MYLLDTNVISETIKKTPNKQVITWLLGLDGKKFFLSVLTLGEIRKGVEKLQDHSKKQKIIQWLENDLLDKFQGRIIPIDARVADKWGYLCASKNFPAVDSMIAASALVYNFKLVTRNTKDFLGIDSLELINPWEQ